MLDIGACKCFISVLCCGELQQLVIVQRFVLSCVVVGDIRDMQWVWQCTLCQDTFYLAREISKPEACMW